MSCETAAMPKEDRELQILRFLSDYDLALPRQPIFVNMKRKRGITFSERTMKRLLDEMVERGEVERLDIGHGYYQITDEGRARIDD